MEESLYINNAGLVILNPYIPKLFERLGLTSENTFKSKEDQLRAVNYLQFLATGTSEAEEYDLVLNKLFCGLDLTEEVYTSIDITNEEKELMEGLLNAVITNWTPLGNTTNDGLRGSFLLRDGKLIEEDGFWQLQVAQKSFDMLLDQLPWSISPMKLPWLDKPIEVAWR